MDFLEGAAYNRMYSPELNIKCVHFITHLYASDIYVFRILN